MESTDYTDYTDFTQLAAKNIRGNSWAKIFKRGTLSWMQ
jgi:hypothetical protein